MTWLSIGFTLALLGVGVVSPALDFARRIHTTRAGSAIEDALVVVIVGSYAWGQLIYEWCRLGYLRSRAEHVKPSRETMESLYDGDQAPPLVVLVPSYCEPLPVLRMTLTAAFLMEHPNRHVVLLIDDPPDTKDPRALRDLAATRSAVEQIEQTFREQQRTYVSELTAFQERSTCGEIDAQREASRLEKLHRKMAQWLERHAESFEPETVAHTLFVERVLLAQALEHRARALEFLTIKPSKERALHEYRRLAARFGARISYFERKLYLNLSHAPNKAMNLNSYLGLLGGHLRAVERPGGRFLERCTPDQATLSVVDAAYILISDADTLLLGHYALTLLKQLEAPGRERVGVTQAPSLAVPGSPSLVQRIAGAETDLQRILCIGSSLQGAAFWLGSNGLIRRQALEDIRQRTFERGFPIDKFIQDRTLVEDMESTIDFLEQGWEIQNVLDVLAFRGTPGDYGSLLVQRRRWAGGGLLILPKYLRYLFSVSGWTKQIPEALLRLYHLGAQAVNLCGLMLPLLPLARAPARGWWLWIAAPYYVLCWQDLTSCGYRLGDFPRLLSLNLMLLSVNVAGTFASVYRAVTGHTRVFRRTPKVAVRSRIPLGYALTGFLAPLLMGLAAAWNVVHHEWSFAALCSFNTILLTYGLLCFMGAREAGEDLLTGLRRLASPPRLTLEP